MMPITKNTKNPIYALGLVKKEKLIWLPEMATNNFFDNKTMLIAINREIKLIKTDSNKYCFINSIWLAPFTFLIPVSFARLRERAVVRLIKLIHAMIRIIKAINNKEKTMDLLICLSAY